MLRFYADDIIRYDPDSARAVTFELGGLQQLLPLGADLLHAAGHLSGGVMLPIQQLLAGLLQGIDAALIGRQLGFKRLVFLHFALQVGWVLEAQRMQNGKVRNSELNIFQNGGHDKISHSYLVSLICGGLHLLVDPALELVRVPEELLQVEGVLQGGAARLSTLVQGVAAAEKL